jgi:hypothetical protein
MKKYFSSLHLAPLTLICLLLLGATACQNDQRPDDVLDDKTMADFLTDLYLLEGYYSIESQYQYETVSPEILDACDDILKKHNITRERVEKSFDYYSRHPEKNNAINQEVASRLDKLIGPDEEHSQL